MSGFKRTTYNRPIFVRNRLNRVRTRSYQRTFGASLGSLRFNDNPEFDADGQQKSAKGKAPKQPDRDFEACARLNERKSEERIPRRSGNCYQTLIRTTTGIWYVTYNGENRPILFSNDTAVVSMSYDYMGRRFEYKETVSGTLTRHERYLYRGYLQIAALDMLNSASVKHTIAWDPSERVATRPLALQIGADVYYYSFDQVKNVTELFDSSGAIAATYDYSPFGQLVASTGNVANPITFSSEIHDSPLGLQYYNYRHLNLLDGRWVSRDPIEEAVASNLYNNFGVLNGWDLLGMVVFDFVPAEVKNAPWEWADVPDLGREVRMGWDLTHDCSKCKLEFNVKLHFVLLISTEFKKSDPYIDSNGKEHTKRGVYGHEQKHILADQNFWKGTADKDLKPLEIKYKTVEECEEAAKKAEDIAKQAYVYFAIYNTDHIVLTPSMEERTKRAGVPVYPGWSDVPADMTPYEPIGGEMPRETSETDANKK